MLSDASNRERILGAARSELAEHGYHGASLRGVAERAGVDIRLVHYYFGRRETLFDTATTVAPPAGDRPAEDERGDASPDGDGGADRPPDGTPPGLRLAEELLTAWSAEPMAWRALLVSAMDHQPTAARLATQLEGAFSALTARLAPATTPPYVAVLAAQFIGFAVLWESGFGGTAPTAPTPMNSAAGRYLPLQFDATLARDRTTTRPPTDSSRETILRAARVEFAAHGYAGTTLRAIARRARVHPALIHHYFTTKDAVFAATLVNGQRLLSLVPDDSDEAMAAVCKGLMGAVLHRWEAADQIGSVLTFIRSGLTRDEAGRALAALLSPDSLGIPEQLRGKAAFTALLTVARAHVVGLLMARHIVPLPPLATAELADVIDLYAPVLQECLTAVERLGPES